MNDGAGNDLPDGGEDPSSPSCPICGKPGSQDYRPFCSKRCADVDLGRWLSGVMQSRSWKIMTKTVICPIKLPLGFHRPARQATLDRSF